MIEAVENCHIEITQSISPAGEMIYTVAKRGDVPISTFIGIIELAKASLIRENQESQ